MTSSDWKPLRRDDGEAVGWLAPDGDSGFVRPLLLTGTPLGGPQPADAAAELLCTRGLSALDRRWWCRLPDPLPGGVLPAGQPREEWVWRPVILVDVSADGCTVRPEWPLPTEMTSRARLPVPVGDLLLADPPEEAS